MRIKKKTFQIDFLINIPVFMQLRLVQYGWHVSLGSVRIFIKLLDALISKLIRTREQQNKNLIYFIQSSILKFINQLYK